MLTLFSIFPKLKKKSIKFVLWRCLYVCQHITEPTLRIFIQYLTKLQTMSSSSQLACKHLFEGLKKTILQLHVLSSFLFKIHFWQSFDNRPIHLYLPNWILKYSCKPNETHWTYVKLRQS